MASVDTFCLGLALSLLNCLLSSVGITLQRKAQLLSEQGSSLEPRSRSRLLWAAGVFLYISAAAPDVLAYALVPQVVCTTVACFRLVLVTTLAHSFLQERVRRREVIGMACCSMGTSMCLMYGPRSSDAGPLVPRGELCHPHVWTYLCVSSGVLVAALTVEHAGWFREKQGMRSAALPLATGLAFALEKLFNTELGFVEAPRTLQGLADAPAWSCLVAATGALGLLDFYLNVRAASRMPLQVFLPVSFALATSLQFFQAMFIFGEFASMGPSRAALSIAGAVVALAGALLIQPPKFGVVGAAVADIGAELADSERKLSFMATCRDDNT